MTILSLRLTRFSAIFCAIMLCLGIPLLYADPLILEGRLSAASGAAFHPGFDLSTTAFSISGPGTEREPSQRLLIRGFDDTSGGAQVGQLRTMNTAWVLAEGDPGSATVYGRLFFSTDTFVVPPQPPFGSGVVTGLPFTASGTLLGHDVVGTGFANASFSGGGVTSVGYQFSPAAIPEPGTALLLASGLALVAWGRWRSSVRHRA